MKRTKVYMGIPSMGSREDAQIYRLRQLEKKYAETIELVYPDIFVGRLFHDHARNAFVEQFLNSDCDILWFLDSDVVPPENIFDLIVQHGDKWELAGAPYPVWMTPAGETNKQVVFTVYTKNGSGKLAAAAIPFEGTSMVDGVATGCLFIKRSVFSKLSKPYFEFKYHNESRDIAEGEDLGFCKKVSELGYQFFIDFSMLCHHYKKVSLLEVNNYMLQHAHKAVLACDRAFRQALAKKSLEGSQRKSNLILPK